MRARPPIALVGGVVALHLSMLGVLAGPGLLGRAAPDGRRGGSVRLTLVNPAPVQAPGSHEAPGSDAALRASSGRPVPANVDGQRLSRRDPPADAGASAAPPDRATAPVVYRPQEALDTPIRPRSAPDLSVLEGVSWSGLPLRIRLFIDARGAVVDVQVLQSAEQDDALQRIRAMFLATGFTPATEHGNPVPCFKDIEMNAVRLP